MLGRGLQGGGEGGFSYSHARLEQPGANLLLGEVPDFWGGFLITCKGYFVSSDALASLK